ncbi:unnamed protein product [Ostreobium quekettii]|uniref:Transcription factor CBF/NF-Y/archaeal histone domain-containing protein n=1 Tax=Ostreobium quekettii TaxID=121088 RepID=A0A8S1JBP7_9CHLO|nr:unnamed protein product [Ostreobium quekettii]
MTGRKNHPLAARIKRLMQKDEDVGRIAQATPVLIGRAMELFLKKLCDNVAEYAKLRHARTVTTGHLKACVVSDDMMDFLKEIVRPAPDLNCDDTQPGHRNKRMRMPSMGESSLEGRPSAGGPSSPPSRRSRAPGRTNSLGSPVASNSSIEPGTLTQSLLKEAERHPSGTASSAGALGPSRTQSPSEDTTEELTAEAQAPGCSSAFPQEDASTPTAVCAPTASAAQLRGLQGAPTAPEAVQAGVAHDAARTAVLSSSWPGQGSLKLASPFQQPPLDALRLEARASVPLGRIASGAMGGVPAEEDDYDAEEEEEDGGEGARGGEEE